jgi:hypothetical protein
VTWASLVDRVLTGFPHTDFVFNETKAQKYLEEAQEDFAFYTKCYEKSFSYYLDEGDTILPLPRDFIDIISTVEFKGRYIAPFQRHEIISRRKVDNTFRSGTPEYFQIEGNNMSFIPSPSQGGLLSFRYAAKPTNLTDSATAYSKLNYDTLSSSAPYIGDTVAIKRLSGSTYGDIVFSATVADYEDKNLTGTLILSDVSSGTNLNNNDLVVTTNDETEMFLALQGNWTTLISNWDDLGLGFKALANGTVYDFVTAGDEPQINQIYHPMLVDYAKASFHWETASGLAPGYTQKYEQNRENVRRQYAHRMLHGPSQVADTIGL